MSRSSDFHPEDGVVYVSETLIIIIYDTTELQNFYLEAGSSKCLQNGGIHPPGQRTV
jgi:hypothetical protein